MQMIISIYFNIFLAVEVVNSIWIEVYINFFTSILQNFLAWNFSEENMVISSPTPDQGSSASKYFGILSNP